MALGPQPRARKIHAAGYDKGLSTNLLHGVSFFLLGGSEATISDIVTRGMLLNSPFPLFRPIRIQTGSPAPKADRDSIQTHGGQSARVRRHPAGRRAPVPAAARKCQAAREEWGGTRGLAASARGRVRASSPLYPSCSSILLNVVSSAPPISTQAASL